MKKYVFYNEQFEPIKLESRTHALPNSMPCPEAARHFSEISIVDDIDELSGEVRGKKAVLDAEKIAQYDALLASQEAARQKEIEIAKKRARLDFGMNLKAEVMVLNESKNWDQLTWDLYMSNQHIKNLSSLLVDGYLQTSLNLLLSADLSAFYTTEEKQVFIDKIQNYLAAE